MVPTADVLMAQDLTPQGGRGDGKGITYCLKSWLGVQQDVCGYNPVEMGFQLTRGSTAQIFTSP